MIGDAFEHFAEVSTKWMQFALLIHFGHLESPLNYSLAIDFSRFWLLGDFLDTTSKQLLQRGNIIFHLFQITLFLSLLGLFSLGNQRNWTNCRFHRLWGVFCHILLVLFKDSLYQSIFTLSVCRILFKIWLTKLFLNFFKLLLVFHEVV